MFNSCNAQKHISSSFPKAGFSHPKLVKRKSHHSHLSRSPVTKFRLHGLMSSEISWMFPIIMINMKSNTIYQDVLNYGYNFGVVKNVKSQS